MSTGIRQYFSPTMRLPSHKDTGIRVVATREANGGVKRVLEKQASQQSTKKGTQIPTSLTLTEPRSADTQLSMGMPLLNVTIVTTRVLVKIEGGAKIGTAHLQR